MIKIFTFLFVYAFSSVIYSAERIPLSEVKINKFIEDTQEQLPVTDDKHLAMVWWVPFEYWKSALGRDSSISEVQKEAIYLSLRNISLLATVQADVSTLGAFQFYTKEEIEKNLDINFSNKNFSNEKLSPLTTIDQDLEILLAQMTPVLGAAMGNLGNNMHFFVLDNISSGKGLIDPYEEGVLSLEMQNRVGSSMKTEIEMPINALYYPRKCPNGKDAHISWKFCPWSGKKLD